MKISRPPFLLFIACTATKPFGLLADIQIQGDEFSVADPTLHFHSDNGGSFGNGPDFLEIGEFSSETCKGMAEFNIIGQSAASSATVTCFVDRRGGLFSGTNNFINNDFNVDIYTYVGNNLEDLGDFNIPTISLAGTFNTAGLGVGSSISVDVTADYNDLIDMTAASLGIRMETTDSTNGGAITLEQCSLNLVEPVRNCCEPHGGDGCCNTACEGTVCSLDGGLYSACCDITWDQECADLAKDNCGNLCRYGGDTCCPTCPDNPCVDGARGRELYHKHCDDPAQFIQCNAWGRCFERPCAPGTVWNDDANTCVHG